MTFVRNKGRGTKYGHAHQQARKQWLAITTPHTPCARCRQPLGPAQLTTPTGRKIGLWHLDHDEHGGYLGFSHRRCNEKAGQSKGARITNARRQATQLDW